MDEVESVVFYQNCCFVLSLLCSSVFNLWEIAQETSHGDGADWLQEQKKVASGCVLGQLCFSAKIVKLKK